MLGISHDKLVCRDAVIPLCCELIGARSDNPPGDIRLPASVARSFLMRHGIEVFEVARVPEKPNLFATVEGSGDGPHLIFNAHLDTIGVGELSDWTVPPFEATRRGGRIYGLGCGNMKGAVAALCVAFAELANNRPHFRGRVSLTLVADETVFGPDGAGYLLEKQPNLLGDGVICGEGPGAMALGVAEKGLLWLEITCRVPSGQGMLIAKGGSAIARLSRILLEIDSWNALQVSPPHELSSLSDHAGEHGFRLSANAGTIRGGRFVSQKADLAVAEVDFRIPPGLTTDEVERRVRTACGGLADVRRIKGWEPNWCAVDDPVSIAVAEAAQAVRGRTSPPVVRLPASDASRWRARGVPAVCFGPQPLLASGVDDYVEEQDLRDCAAIYADAAIRWLNRYTDCPQT